MKPLLRWIVGPCKPLGFDILKESVRTVKALYPEFDLLICHNQLKYKEIEFLKELEVPLYAQKPESLPYKPTAENWKLYPPRLRLDACELVIDNDVVFTKRLPEIETLLHRHVPVVCAGIWRNFGKYDKRIPDGYTLNSGIYGLPPKYDFEKAILEFIKDDEISGWSLRFDDQGIVAGTLGALNHVRITDNVALLQPFFKQQLPSACVYHFICANREDQHLAWNTYKRNLIKLL